MADDAVYFAPPQILPSSPQSRHATDVRALLSVGVNIVSILCFARRASLLHSTCRQVSWLSTRHLCEVSVTPQEARPARLAAAQLALLTYSELYTDSVLWSWRKVGVIGHGSRGGHVAPLSYLGHRYSWDYFAEIRWVFRRWVGSRGCLYQLLMVYTVHVLYLASGTTPRAHSTLPPNPAQLRHSVINIWNHSDESVMKQRTLNALG